MKGLQLMYNHKYRKYYIAVSALGLVGMIGEKIAPFVLLKKLTPEQHYFLFLWLTLGGLFVIGFCKERFDDERAKMIRLKALQLSFMLVISTMLAFALTMSFVMTSPAASTAATNVPEDPSDAAVFFMFPGLGIICYLLTYYVGLYFDQFWDFEDKERSVWQNIKAIPKNIGGILVYLLVATITLLLITLI